jgi:tRNA modification GTPase
VANKTDLLRTTATADLQLPAGIVLLHVSAKEKQHIEELKQLIYQKTVKGQLSGDETMITNIRHLEALQKTEVALHRVLNGLEKQVTSDFLAMDIKQALHYLGEITGAVTTDDLLDNIFSKFCIGK